MNYLLHDFQMIAEGGGLLEWIAGNEAGTPKLQWAAMPESWAVFVLILVVAAIAFAVFWMYLHERTKCPRPILLLMAVMRFAVLGLLVLVFLRPSVFFQQVNEIKPVFGMLRDSSLSFARSDTYRDPETVALLAESTGADASQLQAGSVQRSRLLVDAVNLDPKWMEQVRDKATLQIYDFSTSLDYVGLIPATVSGDAEESSEEGSSGDNQDESPERSNTDRKLLEAFPEMQAGGTGTDIWQALNEVLDDPGRLAAIIVASDFQHNGSENPAEIAKKAAALGIPIYAIGVGDPNPPKNLEVRDNIYVRDQAYPDEPFEIKATIQSTRRDRSGGLPGQIKVELLQHSVVENEIGEGVVVQSRDYELPENGGLVQVEFGHVLGNPGTYAFTVRTPAIDGETEVADNEGTSPPIQVIDEKVRVLLISGQPSWDYTHLYRLLKNDQTILLSCWLQSQDETRPQEGDRPITRLPQTAEEMKEYNVIIMMDPDPRNDDFQDVWMEELSEFCRTNYGGFLYIAGSQFSAEFLSRNKLKGLRDILPVRFGDSGVIRAAQAIAAANNSGSVRMLPIDHNMDHPVMSFRPDPAESRQIWGAMPGIYWSFPALDPRPTARVLVEVPDGNREDGTNQPLIVTGRYGGASVMYMGFQGTWRWRPIGLQAQYFDRFWIQIVRFLVESRSLQGSRRGFIDVDRTEYEIGNEITLVGKVLDVDFQPEDQEKFKVNIVSSDDRKETVDMKLLPGQPGKYQAVFKATRIGNFDATIELSSDSAEQEKLIKPVSFRIVPPRVESSAYWLNEKLMMEIAARSGGEAFRLNELDRLAETLPRLITRAEFNSLPRPLWDISNLMRWLAFFLPVVLLTLEWAMRKYYKLM